MKVPILQLPEAEDPKVQIEMLALEAGNLNKDVAARKELLDKVLQVVGELDRFEIGISQAKIALLELMRQRLRRGEVECADEYCALLRVELDGVIARSKDGSKAKGGK